MRSFYLLSMLFIRPMIIQYRNPLALKYDDVGVGFATTPFANLMQNAGR